MKKIITAAVSIALLSSTCSLQAEIKTPISQTPLLHHYPFLLSFCHDSPTFKAYWSEGSQIHEKVLFGNSSATGRACYAVQVLDDLLNKRSDVNNQRFLRLINPTALKEVEDAFSVLPYADRKTIELFYLMIYVRDFPALSKTSKALAVKDKKVIVAKILNELKYDEETQQLFMHWFNCRTIMHCTYLGKVSPHSLQKAINTFQRDEHSNMPQIAALLTFLDRLCLSRDHHDLTPNKVKFLLSCAKGGDLMQEALNQRIRSMTATQLYNSENSDEEIAKIEEESNSRYQLFCKLGNFKDSHFLNNVDIPQCNKIFPHLEIPCMQRLIELGERESISKIAFKIEGIALNKILMQKIANPELFKLHVTEKNQQLTWHSGVKKQPTL